MAKEGLFILAFDHRGSILKGIFGVSEPTPKITEEVKKLKLMIYSGIKKAVDNKWVDKNSAAVLVDEQYGEEVLKQAKKDGIQRAMPVEKSGQKMFDFEKGKDGFPDHIERNNPDFVKVLVRYNPKDDNSEQIGRLKILNDYLKEKKKVFLFELLIEPKPDDVKDEKAKKHFDLEVRPALMAESIDQLQLAGILPGIWKIEGLDKEEDVKKIVRHATSLDKNAKIVILGRGESKEHVKQWIAAGTKTPGVSGFAVGRTIFMEALRKHVHHQFTEEDAINEIATNYKELVDVWNSN